MRFNFRTAVTAALAALSAAAMVSCSSEIDLGDGLDTTVTWGGEAFSLPIGSTAEMTVGDFLELSEGDIIRIDESGNYYLEFVESFSQTISMSQFAQQLTVPGFAHSFEPRPVRLPDFEDIPDVDVPEEDIPVEDVSDIIVDGDKIGVNMGFEEEFIYEFGFEEAKDEGLESIDRVDLSETFLRPEIELSGLDELPESMEVRVTVEVPEHYVFEESPMVDPEAGTVTFTGVMNDEGVVEFTPVTLVAIEFEPGDDAMQDFVFTDTFAVTQSVLMVSREDLEGVSGGVMDAALTIIAGSDDGNLRPESFRGKVDIDVDPVNESLVLTGIPDMLKSEDASLDFYNPRLTARVSTNANVPVDMHAQIIPVFPTGDGDEVSLDLEAPVSPDPDVIETALFWISSDDPSGNLDAAGYEWVEADVRGLLTRIPDEVRVNITAGTDPTESAYVVCDEEYTVGGEFAFNVPFSFGENLKFAVRDTIDGMPEILSTLVRSANVRISGTVTTTIPVNVNLRAYFLDAWMDRIDMPEITQLINGTASAGTPQETPLELNVPQTDIRNDISYLVFEFQLLSGQTPGIPLSEDSSIQADIILNVPGGVTVDFNDLNF